MRKTYWALILGLVVPAGGLAAEDAPPKALVGKWGLVEEKPMPPSQPAAARPPAGQRNMPPARPKDELPKVVLEFTTDGKVRVDGEPAAFDGRLKTLKPLGDVLMQVG